MKKVIFIHIPKTGGSTFTNLLRDTFDPNNRQLSHFIQKIQARENIEFDIRHLQFRQADRPSMCGDIFSSPDNFTGSQIYTIIRDPVDRLISEFIFQKHVLRNGPKIRKLVPLPETFEEYVANSLTWNYQTWFLLGGGLSVTNPVTESDFDRVIQIMNQLDIHVGVTDEYEKFVEMVEQDQNIQLPTKIQVLKQSHLDLKSKIKLTPKLRQQIYETNKWDLKLYQHAKDWVKNRKTAVKSIQWQQSNNGNFKF